VGECSLEACEFNPQKKIPLSCRCDKNRALFELYFYRKPESASRRVEASLGRRLTPALRLRAPRAALGSIGEELLAHEPTEGAVHAPSVQNDIFHGSTLRGVFGLIRVPQPRGAGAD
jgi:hypothetical protein